MRELAPTDIAYLRSIAAAVEGRRMFGLGNVVNALVVALLAGGHVLLEGNPGLGKTELVKALSAALGLGTVAVGRIQFTPDLMPSDITGTLMPDAQDRSKLRFQRGPIFHQLLLADEINRATPKTQAAMLEAMAEYQVTVLGKREPLRFTQRVGAEEVVTPFMVMATQNPIDQEGTYDLPEAQSDRFMFKIRMEMPGAEVMGKIIAKSITPQSALSSQEVGKDDPDAIGAALLRLRDASDGVMSMELPPVVQAHIINVVMASNGRMDQVVGVSKARAAALRALIGDRVLYPFGPRAATSLAKAALGWSAVALTQPEDAHGAASGARRGLAAIAIPVLRHRIRITPDATVAQAASAEAEVRALDDYIAQLIVAAAPDSSLGDEQPGYHDRFAASITELRAVVRL